MYTYHSHDNVRLQVTYHDGSAFSGFSSLWRLLFHKRNDEIREGRREGRRVKRARIHRKRIGASSGTIYLLFRETYFALSTYHAPGVLCRGICLRCITLAKFLTCHVVPGVRNTRCRFPRLSCWCVHCVSVCVRRHPRPVHMRRWCGFFVQLPNTIDKVYLQ